MVRRCFALAVACVTLFSAAVFSQAPLTLTSGRVAVSHDGNAWDKDDVMAFAVEWAMMASFGMQKKFVHAEHSVIGKNCQDAAYYAQMMESAKGPDHFPGFDKSIIFDAWADIAATVAHFKVQAEKSSADDRLFFALAGPMEVPWRDINAVSTEKRQFITCVSHSTANDGMGACQSGGATSHKWADLQTSFGANGTKFVHIPDQNANLGGKGSSIWNFCTSMPANTTPANNIIPASAWTWLKGRDFKANGDCSDAGMVWYILTGSTSATVANDLQLRFKNPLPMQGVTNIKSSAGAAGIFNNNVAITVSPNNRVLKVKATGIQGNGSISMYNILSKVVCKAPMVSGQAQLALGRTPAGKYIVAIESKGQKAVKEILLK